MVVITSLMEAFATMWIEISRHFENFAWFRVIKVTLYLRNQDFSLKFSMDKKINVDFGCFEVPALGTTK